MYELRRYLRHSRGTHWGSVAIPPSERDPPDGRNCLSDLSDIDRLPCWRRQFWV